MYHPRDPSTASKLLMSPVGNSEDTLCEVCKEIFRNQRCPSEDGNDDNQ
jgi:hypothetical protein